MLNALFILPLSQGWMYPFFSEVRSKLTAISGSFISVVLCLCCLFVGINLIKIIISITSDDQGSGFADITLRQIVRPFILIMVISAYGTIFGAFDSLVNNVTVAVASSIQKQTPPQNEQYDQALKDQGSIIDRIASRFNVFSDGQFTEEQINEMSDRTAAASGIKYDIDGDTQKLQELAEGNGYQKKDKSAIWEAIKGGLSTSPTGALGVFGSIFGGYLGYQSGKNPNNSNTINAYIQNNPDIDESIKKEANDLNERIKTGTNFRAEYRDKFREVEKSANQFSWLRNISCILVNWIFDKFYIIFECFAEIYLVVLAIMGPIIFALSILSSWENCWQSFIAKYIEISSWKITAAIICLTVTTARGMVVQYNNRIAEQFLSTGVLDPNDVSSVGVWALKAIFSIAGLIMLKQIPSMTSTLFGLAQNTDRLQAGGVVGSVVNAGKAVGSVLAK